MNVVLEPDVERWLAEEARRAEMSPEKYLSERLRKEHELLQSFPVIGEEEAQLLAKINEGFSDEFWTRYRLLIAQREARTITEGERQELIRLSDQVEAKNAERVPYLTVLAQHRGVSLPELMQQLGLHPMPVMP